MPSKILIVDDEVIVAESMRAVLGRLGYAVSGAVNSAQEALAAIAQERPDLVLMDINLGANEEGIGAAETIRALHGLPVVYVTAYADEATLAHAKITHPFGYITKPFEAHDLRVAIEIALHNHTLEQRLKISEGALAEKAEIYRVLLGTALDGILETDEDDAIVDANQAYCRLLGYTLAELTTLHIAEIEVDLTPAAVKENTLRVKREGNARFETRHRARDGRLVDFDISITHIPSRRRFVAFCRDITQRKQAESELRRTGDFNRGILDSMKSHLCVLDESGRILAVNRAWREFTTANPPTIANVEVGANYLAVCAATTGADRVDAQAMVLGIGSVVRGELAEYRLEYACHSPDQQRWFLARVTRFFEAGQIRIVISHIDISERKQAELALRESEEEYRCLFESSRDAIIILEPPAWKFTAGNPAAAKMFEAKDEAELVNHGPWDISPERQPDGSVSADKARDMIETAMREGSLSFEWTHRRIGGEDFSATVLLSRIQSAGKTFLQATVRDITDQKRAEMALQLEQSLFNSLVSTIPDHIYFKDRQSRFVRINDRMASSFGLRCAAEAVGKTDFDFFTAEHAQQAHADEERVMSTGGPLVGIEEKETWPDGRITWVSSTKVPLRDAAGTITGLVGISRDITEHKHAEQELHRTSRWLLATQRISAVGGWALNVKTGAVWASPEARRIYGADDRELTLPVIQSFPLPQYRPVLDQALKDLVERGQRYDIEYQITRANDGATVDILTTATYDPAENLVLGVVQDITEKKRADTELRESEEKFEKVFRDAPVWISISDLTDGTYVDVNEEAFRRSGYSREEIIGRPANQVPWLPTRPRVRVVREIQRHGRVSGLEVTYRTKNGGALHGLLNGELTTIGGRPCLLTVSTDITARKQMEAALRESEERLRVTLESTQIGIWDWDVKSDQCYASPTYYTMLGYEPKAGYIDRVEWLERAHPEERPTVAALIARVLEQQESAYEYDARIRHANGTYRWIHVKGSVLSRDAAGKAIRFVGTRMDITERKHAEEALRESEERFAKAFRDSPSGMAIRDLETGKYIDANDRCLAMTGYSREEVIGRSPMELGWWTDGAEQIENQQRITEKQGTTERELRLRHKNGQLAFILNTSHTVRIGGRPCILSISVDITARRKAEAEREALTRALEQKNRELENLIYVTSHDLRSPMLNIQGFSRRIEVACQELAKYSTAAPFSAADHAALTAIVVEQLPKSLDYIRTSVEKMDRLINGLLRLSRLGRAGLRPEPLDVNAMFRDILGALAFSIQAAGATVEVGALPPCRGDAVQMNQLFTNLLDNALKYRDPARPLRVSISGRVDAGRTIYCMADTGAGIAPEHQEKIWEVFFRANPGGPVTGEGLGLNLVHRIVERHQGEIWVESKVGQGSRFYVALPAVPPGTVGSEL